jgi:hypothetical protein
MTNSMSQASPLAGGRAPVRFEGAVIRITLWPTGRYRHRPFGRSCGSSTVDSVIYSPATSSLVTRTGTPVPLEGLKVRHPISRDVISMRAGPSFLTQGSRLAVHSQRRRPSVTRDHHAGQYGRSHQSAPPPARPHSTDDAPTDRGPAGRWSWPSPTGLPLMQDHLLAYAETYVGPAVHPADASVYLGFSGLNVTNAWTCAGRPGWPSSIWNASTAQRRTRDAVNTYAGRVS